MKLHEIARQARALGIVMGENSGNRERQEKLLALILRYDALCRGAIEKGADAGGYKHHGGCGGAAQPCLL